MFQLMIVILHEISASFHNHQDGCEATGSCPYQASPTNPLYQIGTSIRANSIRQEADSQGAPQQYPYDPNSYAYNYGQVVSPDYYDPYRAGVDPGVPFDPSVSYGQFTDPGYTTGLSSYNDPYSTTGYTGTDPGTTGTDPGYTSGLSSYNDPYSATGYTGTGTDPGTTFPSYSYYDPYQSAGTFYPNYNDPPVDPEIGTDTGSGGGALSNLGNLMSGLDYAGILNAMGRMFGGQNALNPVSSAVNPLSTATSPAIASGITDTSAGGVTTLPFDDRINSDLGPGIPSTISSGTSDSLAGANLHRPTHVNNGEWHETGTLSEKDTYANSHTHVNNGEWHETGSLSEKDSYNSQNQKPEDYNIGTGIRVSKSTKFKGSSDTAGYSSNSKSSQNNIAGLLGAVDHFNSNSEKSDQMLIFTPTDLSKSAISESDYNPLLSDEEIAKAYNSLGKKKRKSVLLLTDGDVKAPHELYEETYPTVLEDTGGNRDLIEKIDKHYQNLLNAPSEEFLSSLQPSVGDIGTGLINFPLTQNNDEDIMKRIRDYYEVITKDQDASTKPLSGIDVNSSAEKMANISTRVRKDNEDFMKQLSSFYEYIPAETNSPGKPSAEIVPHLRKEGKTIINTDEESNNKIVVPRSNEFLRFLAGLKLTESSDGSANEGIMPIVLLTDDAESLLRNLNHSKQVRRDSEGVIERMSDFYEFLPVGGNSFEQTSATKIGKTELDKSNENNSERVRKHNNDIIRSMEEFYEFLPNGEDSSGHTAPGNKNDESEENNPTSKNHERVRKHNNDIMKIMSDYYELIPVSDIDEIVPSTKMHTSQLGKSNENNSERVRKHNNDKIKGMEEFYEFLPIVEDFSEQTAQETKHDKSGKNNPNSENHERFRKHNDDIMKSMREYYEFIPVSDMDQIIPNTKIHKTDESGKSDENSLGRVRKHNNNIIKGMEDFYEFLPIVKNSSEHGTEIDASKERNPTPTSSERVRKHNSDIMKNMGKYYEFIPLNMDSEQTLPSTKVYSHENEKLSENVSGRFRKHNNDIIQSMNNFYEFLPNEMNTSKKSSTRSETHSTQYIMEKTGDEMISAPNKQGVNKSGIGEHFQSAPRVYRMIPKMVPFIKSGINMHSVVKQHIMDDLKSKFKSNFDLDDKLFVIREGIENSKEYFIAKRRDNMQNEVPWCETCESSHNSCELIPRPCDMSHETCEQSPSKYIFRLTCYDPHSDCPHNKDKNFVLHFDCLNKISPLITNILKNVENHHSHRPDCDKCRIHDHCGTNGVSFQNEYSPTCPCYSYDGRFDNKYNYNVNNADVNTLPPPTGNEYGYSPNNQDYKSPTEPVYKKPSEPVYTKPSEPVYTKPSELDYTKPDYTKPTEPDYTKPDYTKPYYTKPTEPDYTKPDYTKPTEPDFTKPDYTKPTEPDYTKPFEPDYTKPTEPYYTKPNEPDYTKPTDPVYTKPSGLPQKNWSEIWEGNQSGIYQKSSSDNNYIIRKSTETDSYLDTYGSNQFSNSLYKTARPISSQSISKINLNNMSDLPSSSETNHQSWNYQPGPVDCSKAPKLESNFFQGSTLDWRPHVISSYSEKPETISWPSKQDSNDWSSPPKFHQETQSTADDTLASSNYDRPTEKYDFHRKCPSHPPKPDVTPPVLPCHECSNNYQPLNVPNKSEQVICESKHQTYSKSPEYNGDTDCEECGGKHVGQFIPDFNYSSPISNGRSSIMTISKGDHNKPKYVNDSCVDQYNTFENRKPVIEKRISHAIETIFNTSLQCCKDQETPPCYSGLENTDKPRAPIIKPVCPGNINGGACLDNQCPEPPKCHMKEHVCTKHTQQILKNPDSAKFVQGFECKKIIQSNLCRESIGPCNCKTASPPASKECECLADFLEKITQTLDKNDCKENEIKECKCKKE